MLDSLVTQPDRSHEILEKGRLESAKPSFVTRFVDLSEAVRLRNEHQPKSGDLVLCRVERLKQHGRIELPCGRRASLYPGDELILVFGDRYATDQFESRVPTSIGPCNLVAAGGIASSVLSKSAQVKQATELQALGVLTRADGSVLNLADFAEIKYAGLDRCIPTIAVVGTGMNTGKTTTVASLIHGAKLRGLKVAAAKVTGTGAGLDRWQYCDAGACRVLDFTDAGLASTYCQPLEQLVRVAEMLVASLQQCSPDLIVLELADGLLQQETTKLIEHRSIHRLVDGWLVAVPDPLAALAAMHYLQSKELNLIGISGLITRSPLAVREVQQATGIPVLHKEDYRDSQMMEYLLTSLNHIEGIAKQLVK